MLKKLLCLLLALSLCLSFLACDENDDDWDDDDEETTAEKDSQIPAPKNFQETTLIEEEDFLVKAKSIKVTNNEWAYQDYIINLYFENNTDHTLSFTIDGGVFNDVSVPGYYQFEIPAGKKSNDSLSFSTHLMELAGITQVTEILLYFETSYDDQETGWTELSTYATTIYPEGLSSHTPYVHTPAKDEVLFYEDEDFIVRIMDVLDEDGGVYALKVYFYNKTQETFEIFLSNSAFNDYLMGDANFWNCRIYPESHAVHELSWDRNLLEENDIETVEKIWLTFSFTNPDDWNDYISVENEFDAF